MNILSMLLSLLLIMVGLSFAQMPTEPPQSMSQMPVEPKYKKYKKPKPATSVQKRSQNGILMPVEPPDSKKETRSNTTGTKSTN